jgi:leucyl/phenylalanyl-tRNA--protein transferase
MIQLDDHIISFPDPKYADEDGALAYGGDLSIDRLLIAYSSGIFPWFSGKTPIWYSPDPRFVLFPDSLKVSKSMQVLLKRNSFHVTVNRDFQSVIRACRTIRREGQYGTWITGPMEQAYMDLHKAGWAVSVEAWQGDRLAGGLYGIRMGRVFFGESMFSHVSNASKYAFISYARQLQAENVAVIDCQVHTPHLESLGAEMIPRTRFLELLMEHLC